MRKFFTLIIYFIGLIFSILIILALIGQISSTQQSLDILIKIYSIYTLLSLTFFLILTFRLEKQEPKTEVKIVYKTIDKEKEAQAKKKKEEKILEKYVNDALVDLDKITEPEKFAEKVLSNFAKTFDIVQGMFFILDPKRNVYYTLGNFAYYAEETYKEFEEGEGITGQVAKNKKFLFIDNVPENYIIVYSGLGSSSPRYLTFVPIVYNDKTIAVIEFANFTKLPEPTEQIFTKIAEKLAPKVYNLISKASKDEAKKQDKQQ